MTPIAVGEYHEIHSVATDAVSKASSGAIGMARSGQLSWVTTLDDAGNLRGGDGNDHQRGHPGRRRWHRGRLTPRPRGSARGKERRYSR